MFHHCENFHLRVSYLFELFFSLDYLDLRVQVSQRFLGSKKIDLRFFDSSLVTFKFLDHPVARRFIRHDRVVDSLLQSLFELDQGRLNLLFLGLVVLRHCTFEWLEEAIETLL